MSNPSGLLRGTRALFAAAGGNAKSAGAAAIPKSAVKKPAATAASKPGEVVKVKRVGKTGIMILRPVSHTLQTFVGSPEISRADALKKIWEHIKLHNLQNPSNKREILCDAKLKKIFNGKDKVGMLEISKLLTPHFVKN